MNNYTLLFISFLSVFPEPNTEKLHRRVPFHEIARPPCCYYRLQEIKQNGVMVAANDTVFTQNVVKTSSRLQTRGEGGIRVHRGAHRWHDDVTSLIYCF